MIEKHRLFFMFIVLTILIFISTVACEISPPGPTPEPTPDSQPALEPVPVPAPSSEPSSEGPDALITQPSFKDTVEYTVKYYTKSDDVKDAIKYWTFGPSTLLIRFESPTVPFTIQKITFLGWIFGNDVRNWEKRTFQLKIWDVFPNNELWAESYPYTDFSPTQSKWQEYEVPDIQAGEAFSVEFLPDAEVATVGYGTSEKKVFKCGVAIGVDYGGNDADSDITREGVVLPWEEQQFDRNPREKVAWMIRVEGEGPP